MNGYERYIRTDELLALQKKPEEMAHRDELIFQTVHQSGELWLQHAAFETETAAGWIREGDLSGTARLLRRAVLGLRLIIPQLEMLEQMSPWDYRLLRRTLGTGSGFDSPGFNRIQRCAKEVGAAFGEQLLARGISLLELYRDPRRNEDAYQVAELLVDWDESFGLWRLHHLKMVERIIGNDAIGTQGHPVSDLRDLTLERCFPELWDVRNELTLLAQQELGASDDEAGS